MVLAANDGGNIDSTVRFEWRPANTERVCSLTVQSGHRYRDRTGPENYMKRSTCRNFAASAFSFAFVFSGISARTRADRPRTNMKRSSFLILATLILSLGTCAQTIATFDI